MFTLGYRFKPWRGDKALADGPSILAYVRETAREYGIDEHIRYGYDARAASWDSDTATWTVTVEHSDGETTRDHLPLPVGDHRLLRLRAGLPAGLPGRGPFAGQVIHPQHWPEDLDHAGKRVVVIGCGATAVTLVPALAESGAGHVTMLQRSPTYILSLPAEDKVAQRLRKVLPEKLAYAATRWKNVGVSTGLFQLSRRRPAMMRGVIRKAERQAAARGLRRRHPLQADATTRGTSGCAWCPTATCSG